MLRSVFAKTLWEQRRALLAWAIGITAVGVFYASFFPALNTPDISAAMESIAPEFMEALGFAAIATPAGYLGSTTFGILGPILLIIMCAWIGTRAIAGDEETGRLDILLAHPVSRTRIVVERYGALLVGVVLVCLVLFAALVAISGVAQLGDIGASNLLAASIHLAALEPSSAASRWRLGLRRVHARSRLPRSPSWASCPTSETRWRRRSTSSPGSATCPPSATTRADVHWSTDFSPPTS